MLREGLGLTAEKGTETVVNAADLAELGAVKPQGFGSLIRLKYPERTEGLHMDGSSFAGLSRGPLFSGLPGMQERDTASCLSLHCTEAAGECAEYLCDYGITPAAWREASAGTRMDMLNTAVRIMAEELSLPPEWARELTLSSVGAEENIAVASCRIRRLQNGGVEIVGVPELSVCPEQLTDDYFAVLSAVCREMIRMQQYASVNGVDPAAVTDARRLALIRDLNLRGGSFPGGARLLDSPYGAEAWAMQLYFQKRLQDAAGRSGE